MHEPILKKKDILKAQYIYNIVLLLVLSLGVSYALVTFLHNEQGFKATITSSLVKITVDEDISFNLTNTSPVSDEEGLQGYSKTLTLTNTATIDSLTTITIVPETSNNIDTSCINYGLYINGVLKKTGDLTNPTIYDGMLLQGEKVTFEVYLWVDEAYTGTGTIFNGTFEVDSKEAVFTMADYVTKLVDKGKGVYKIDNDYRYSGTNPHNYIWFNCKEGTTGGSNNCELWQIVGSLETKSNQYANSYRRIKLVKVDNLDNQTFGSNNTFSGSSIDTYLNETYYTSLTDQSQKMIISSEWNVEGSVLTNTPETSLTSERAEKLYTKVGLLSASDIGYSTSTDNQSKSLNDADLYNNSWLKGSSYYTLTPVSGNTTEVIGNNSTSITNLTVTTASGVKPSVYLIPNVYIKAGNGTQAMPYEIELVNEEEHYSNIKVVGYITYDVNGADVSALSKQAIFADGSTVINRELEDTTEAKFKGWSTTSDGEVVYQKGDTITETREVTLYAVWQVPEKLVDKITSTMPLTEVDTDGTRFVYGSDVDNNYVWYSGKLWRIVSVNSDGSIKLITESNMTIVAGENDEYSTSQARKWLNEEFLSTLYNNEQIIVNGIFDYTYDEVVDNVKPTMTDYVTEKVGLLTAYEYVMTSQNSEDITTTFLYGGDSFSSITSCKSYNPYAGADVYGTYRVGGNISCVTNVNDSTGYNIRPSVNIKSNIVIDGGSGTIYSPYLIDGDKEVGTNFELLNNRLSGEYINFNNKLYRIVKVDEFDNQEFVKVTSLDYNIGTSVFSDDSTDANFNTTSGIGLYLNQWYNANENSTIYGDTYINEVYKSMIAKPEDGIRWYQGPENGTYDYTLAKSGSAISATIGLGYLGEMFSYKNGWLMTKQLSDIPWNIVNSSIQNSAMIPSYTELDVYPFFYLKPNVVITSGSGMPHDPYEISMN